MHLDLHVLSRVLLLQRLTFLAGNKHMAMLSGKTHGHIPLGADPELSRP